MSSYEIEFEPKVLKRLAKIPQPDRGRIVARIEALAVDPRPAGAVKLVGELDTWRVRQGNYRIIYRIEDEVRIVVIARVAPRGEVYE